MNLHNQIQAWLAKQGKVGNPPFDYSTVDRNDGTEIQILHWDEEILGPQPTKEELQTVTTEAEKIAVKELQRTYVFIVQQWLDATAREFGFNDIVTAISYVDDTINTDWQLQAEAFLYWRTKVWEKLFKLFQNTSALPKEYKLIIPLLPQPAIPSE